LEGQEFNALTGAERLLEVVEVLMIEVRFFDVYHSGHHTFDAVSALARERGFAFYDCARLVGRQRDDRLHFGDVIFIRGNSQLLEDVDWK